MAPEQVRAVFDEAGLTATVIREQDDYLEIRTEQVVGLREAPAPSVGPSAPPLGSASPAATGPAGCCSPVSSRRRTSSCRPVA